MGDTPSEEQEFTAAALPHPIQLTIILDLIGREPGASAVTFTVPPESSLFAGGGSAMRSLMSVRDLVIRELDSAFDALGDG